MRRGRAPRSAARPKAAKTRRGPSNAPFRRFDCFFADEERAPDAEDVLLDQIARKVGLLALHISRIENRLSDYETRAGDDLEKRYRLEDVPPP